MYIFCCHSKEIMKYTTFIIVTILLIGKIRNLSLHGHRKRKKLRYKSGFMYGDMQHSEGSKWVCEMWDCHVSMLIVVFWVVTPCDLAGGYQCFFNFEDRGDTSLRNVGNYPQCYAVSQLKISHSTSRCIIALQKYVCVFLPKISQYHKYCTIIF
jgi:hypothetical protein